MVNRTGTSFSDRVELVIPELIRPTRIGIVCADFELNSCSGSFLHSFSIPLCSRVQYTDVVTMLKHKAAE